MAAISSAVEQLERSYITPQEQVQSPIAPHIELVQAIPLELEKTRKKLRLTLPSHWEGELTYSAKELEDGNVEVNYSIGLPPDPEEEFTLLLKPANMRFPEDLFELIRRKIIRDYVFKTFEKKRRGGEKRTAPRRS